MKKESNQILPFLFFIACPLLVGYLSSQLSGPMTSDYISFVRPDFFPPSWLFAPVWTILFILMGISAYLVWRKGEAKSQLTIFSIQLFLNFIWTPIFFGLNQYFWAFVEILILLVMIILTIRSFAQKSKTAAYLMIPYLLWVCFASILNYVIFMNN